MLQAFFVVLGIESPTHYEQGLFFLLKRLVPVVRFVPFVRIVAVRLGWEAVIILRLHNLLLHLLASHQF